METTIEPMVTEKPTSTEAGAQPEAVTKPTNDTHHELYALFATVKPATGSDVGISNPKGEAICVPGELYSVACEWFITASMQQRREAVEAYESYKEQKSTHE